MGHAHETRYLLPFRGVLKLFQRAPHHLSFIGKYLPGSATAKSSLYSGPIISVSKAAYQGINAGVKHSKNYGEVMQ